MPDQTIMARIMALLAKAEATDYEHEAAAYLAKAQELMIKHAIEESHLKPEQREKITTVRIPVPRNNPDHFLFHVVAKAADCDTVVHAARRGQQVYQSIVGLPSDIEYVQALYASLLLQRERMLSLTHKPSNINGRSWNHSFRMGFQSRIKERLQKPREEAAKEASTALVLRDKALATQDAFKAAFPKTTTLSVSSSSAAGHRAGQAAGSRADVSGGRNTFGRTHRGELV